MITSGSIIKMVNPIAGFDMVGEKFEITSVSEDGTVTFKAPFGVGMMSAREMNKHFEAVAEEETKIVSQYIWTDWLYGHDDIFGDYLYKTNGKKVKVQWAGYKASATCYPTDSFNLKSGCSIALGRAYLKYALKEHGGVSI